MQYWVVVTVYYVIYCHLFKMLYNNCDIVDKKNDNLENAYVEMFTIHPFCTRR